MSFHCCLNKEPVDTDVQYLIIMALVLNTVVLIWLLTTSPECFLLWAGLAMASVALIFLGKSVYSIHRKR